MKSEYRIGISKESYAALQQVRERLKAYKPNPSFDDAVRYVLREEFGTKRYDRLGREEVFAGFGNLDWLRKDINGLLGGASKMPNGLPAKNAQNS